MLAIANIANIANMKGLQALAGILALVSGGCASSTETTPDASESKAGAEAIEVRSEPVVVRSRVDEPLEIRFTAYNTGENDLRFLVWNTPFDEALSADLFEIVFDGARLEYRGIMYRRALPPDDDDYLTLGGGESLEAVVDLAQSYAFDRPGQYTISFRPQPPLAIDDSGDVGAALMAVGEPITIERY